jgi:hypothetical protein
MAKLQTYGLPVVDGADQDYYDRAYARTQDALTGISKTANVQGQLSQFLSDGTGGGIWPGPPTAPDIPTPPPPSGGGGGPSIGPPPVYQPHPDNETTSTHRRPVYRGPSQSNEDLFADLMANVQGGGGGGAPPPPPPPPAGGGDGGDNTQPPPPGGTGGGDTVDPIITETERLVDAGGDTSKGTETPNRPHSVPPPTPEPSASIFPFDVNNLPPVVATSISQMWQQWPQQGDTLGFLNMLANSKEAGSQAQQWARSQLPAAVADSQ